MSKTPSLFESDVVEMRYVNSWKPTFPKVMTILDSPMIAIRANGTEMVAMNITGIKEGLNTDGTVALNLGALGGDMVEVAPLSDSDVITDATIHVYPISTNLAGSPQALLRSALHEVPLIDGMFVPLSRMNAVVQVRIPKLPQGKAIQVTKDTEVIYIPRPSSLCELPYQEVTDRLERAMWAGARAMLLSHPMAKDLEPVLKAWANSRGLHYASYTGFTLKGTRRESENLSRSVAVYLEPHVYAPKHRVTNREHEVMSMIRDLKERSHFFIGLSEAPVREEVEVLFDDKMTAHLPDASARRAVLRTFSMMNPLPDGNGIIQMLAGQSVWDMRYIMRYASRLVQESGARSIGVETIDRAITETGRGTGFVRSTTKFSDIGGYAPELVWFIEQVLLPFLDPTFAEEHSVEPQRGIIIYGPPGCGKTNVVRAFATISRIRFRAVKGTEVVSKYIGESEKLLARVFEQARLCRPSVLFFDEIDALAPDRKKMSNEAGTEAKAALLSTLLDLVDGIDTESGVLLMGNTNRMNEMDPAMLRRVARVYWREPTMKEQKLVLQKQFQMQRVKTATFSDSDWARLLASVNFYTPSDLKSLVEVAMRTRMGESWLSDDRNPPPLSVDELIEATQSVAPTFSPSQKSEYEEYARKHCNFRPERLEPDANHWKIKLGRLLSKVEKVVGSV